jgi:hypothetical protein
VDKTLVDDARTNSSRLVLGFPSHKEGLKEVLHENGVKEAVSHLYLQSSMIVPMAACRMLNILSAVCSNEDLDRFVTGVSAGDPR